MFRPVLTIAVLIALGGAVVATTLQSVSPPKGAIVQNAPAPQMKSSEMGWLRDLDLSADQMQKIRSIRSQYKDRLTSQRQAAHQSQQELRSMMAGDATSDQIRTQYRQVQTLHQQMAETQFNSMLEMREVLTPPQRRKFAERMERRRGNSGMRRPGMNKEF